MSGNTEKYKRPPLPTREKYAQAFREGAEVVIHTDHGDEVHRVRKRPDGAFEWEKVRDAIAPEDTA